jgi:hypothetical protein
MARANAPAIPVGKVFSACDPTRRRSDRRAVRRPDFTAGGGGRDSRNGWASGSGRPLRGYFCFARLFADPAVREVRDLPEQQDVAPPERLGTPPRLNGYFPDWRVEALRKLGVLREIVAFLASILSMLSALLG